MITFDDRCISDPQGVIKDLVGQTSKQAATIHKLNIQLIEHVKKLVFVVSKVAEQQAMADDSWVPKVEEVMRAAGITDTIQSIVREQLKTESQVKPAPKPRTKRTKTQQTLLPEEEVAK